MIKYWYPFDKDERNCGLATGQAIVSAVTFTDGGVLGKYANFGGSTTKYIRMPIDGLTGITTACTVCFWMKIDSWNVGYQTIFAFLKNTINWTGNVFTFIRNSTASAFTFSISDGSSSTQGNFTTNNCELNRWYHFACVYKTGQMLLYQDGALSKTYDTTVIPCFSAITHATLGVECSTSFSSVQYQHRGGISDFRVYDHVLEDWEIKRIYNCKAFEMDAGLHLRETTNLGGSSISYNGKTYGYEYNASSWGGDTGKVKFFKNGGYNNLPYKEYHKITSGAGGMYGSTTRDIKLDSGKTYTMSIWIKSSRNYKDSPHSFNINGVIPNDNNHYITYGSYPQFTTEWKRIHRTFTTTTAETGYFYEMSIIYDDAVPDYYVYYSGFQLEEGDKPTEFTYGHRDETFIDLSGLGNEMIPYNLVKSGSSIFFNGVDAAIQIPLHKIISAGTWSINLWFLKPTGMWSSKGYETLIGGPSGFELEAKSAATNVTKIIMWNWGHGSCDYEFDKWNMVTFTRTSSGTKLYLNGVQKATGSAGSMPAGDYFIGAWKTSTQQNFKGYIRRVSVYKKELTQEDITNLYLHNE